MAKDTAELQALPQPQSRNEKYLNYIAGRAVDLNLLPDPQSRIEEYLEYLCYNRGQGGGGQPQPFNGVENVTYDEARNRTIFKTKGGQEEIVVEGLVTRWKHLDHVTESNIFNIFNPTTFIEGRYYGVNGVVVNNLNWGHFNIPCSAGETLTVFKKTYDSKNFGLLDSNVNWFSNLVVNSTTDGAWQKFLINIPQDQRVVYLSIPVYKVDNDYRNEVMVFRGNVQAPAEFIPFTNNREISIDGEKVNISFEASTTTLSTNNVVDAIKELDMKVTNASTGIVTSVNNIPPVAGNVTVTSNNISYDNAISNLASNNVKEAIDELSEKSKNNYNDSTYNPVTGKLVLIKENGQNKEYDLATGTVKTVNGQQPQTDGNVTVNAEHIGYNTSNTNLNFQNVQEVLDYLEKDKASLNKNNVFIGHNTFNEVNLLGKTPFVEAGGVLQNSGHRGDVYCGFRYVSTHKNNPAPNKQYVSAVKIRIIDSLNAGDLVGGVYLTEIKKGASRADDIVGKTIVSNGTFIVEKDTNYEKCIYVPVEKEYTEDTYFLIGKGDRKRELRECFCSDPATEFINNLLINDLPNENELLNHTTGNGWIVTHALITNDINVRDELDLLKNKVSSAVISVNKETPIDGNVTINAGHIKYNNATSGLVSTDVQKAIDELKKDMVLLDTSDIHIVSDNAKLTDLLNQNTLKHGDLIYIIDSNGVVDFNGTNVGNSGNPIAMIYDNNIAGNKLRVFSRFSSNVNVSADNVSYDDAQTNLQANNVQDAIGKLNEKIANAGGGTVTSVNGINPQGGEVTLTAAVTQNIGQDIVFQVGNQANFAILQCMTNQDVTTIIDGFIL